MKRRLFTALLAALPTVTQIAPALAQTTAAATTDPNAEVSLPGLLYDPDPEPSPTFQQLTGAEQAGYVETPPLPDGVQLPYQVDRAWAQGTTPDGILKFGDLKLNPATAQFTQLTLREISEKQGVDIAGVPVGDVPLVYGLTIEEVDNLYTKINNGEKITVDDAAPAIQAAVGVLYDPSQAGKQLQQAALTAGERVLIEKLSQIPALKGIPLQDLAKGNWEGVIEKAEQIELGGIGEKIGPTLKKLPVDQIMPIVNGVIQGDWEQVRQRAQDYLVEKGTEIALEELYKAVPELRAVPLGAITDLQNQPIEEVLPKVVDMAIEEIPGSDDEAVNSVPGLSQIPVNDLPFDIAVSFLAGDVFAKFDIAYSGVEGKEEPSVNHPLSGGSEDQRFRPTKCTIGSSGKQRADNCPHFEMAKTIGSLLEAVTNIENDVEGKQWTAGDSGGEGGQGVKGGKGILKLVNFGWEPAGIHPFGTDSHTKFVLKDIKEHANKPSTARLHLAFQYCVYILFTEHCTPHFLVIPTPFTVREGGWFLVASRRSLRGELAKLRNRAFAAGFDQIYCDPDNLIAAAGQSDTAGSSPPADAKYGHLLYEETNEQLFEVTAVDGVRVGLTKDAADAFEKMRADAAAQGLDIKAVSGFRSVADQKSIWDDKVASASPEVVAQTSAPPGHSEHHTGLAVDVGNNQNASLNESWAQTPEYAWMQANAGKYGYELSFPEDESGAAGFEPWHWRYVGSEQAAATFSHTASNSGSKPSTPADPDHNLRQYLARIAVGESNRGTDIGPNDKTGAYGEYQFIPSTRDIILERYGLDGWSADKAERDQATLALIEAFGQQDDVGVDIIGLIKAGDFAQADKLLGQHVYDSSGQVIRWGQFTSLPGGAEQHQIWNDPAVLEQYGPTGSASTNAPTTLASAGLPCKPGAIASSGNVPSGIIQPEGNGIATGEFGNPTPGYPVTDIWGHRPWRGRHHAGIDLGTPIGTPVLASDGGIVEVVKYDGGYGNLVVVNHGNGYSTAYAHLSESQVQPGQKVTKDQQIALSGNTGLGTGPHLHFEIIRTVNGKTPSKGNDIDPQLFVNFSK